MKTVRRRQKAKGSQAAKPALPPASSLQPPTSPQSGLTLVELLVVIVLLTTLVTTAIPIISPGGETRKLREASRNINAYFKGAQARAQQTGRPFGVALRRLSADTLNAEHNAVCAQLQYVEVPPAYSGVDDSSLVRILVGQQIGQIGLQFVRYGALGEDGLPTGYDADLIPSFFLRPGDTIEIGGRRYTLSEGNNLQQARSFERTRLFLPLVNGEGTFGRGYFGDRRGFASGISVILLDPTTVDVSALRLTHDEFGRLITDPERYSPPDGVSPQNLNFFATTPEPYKIYRQPTPAGGEPLELPSGVAIDLQASVFGNGARLYRPEVDYSESANEYTHLREEDVMVLFSPEGSIHRVHGAVPLPVSANQIGPAAADPSPVTSYLALCVGRRELIPALLPNEEAPDTRQEIAEPIDLANTALTDLSETELREVTDKYNWLNLESRWVVIGGQSGSVTTVENSAVYPPSVPADAGGRKLMSAQLAAALENAPRRTATGGR